MCHVSCLYFGIQALSREEVAGRKVLDVGSRDINGSLRGLVQSMGPSEYIGVDMEPGTGVDRVCAAEDLAARFGPDSFDIVVTTEMLEHVRAWREGLSNIKRVCRPGGLIVVTTRSRGFPYHGYPYDFWRYEARDMRAIFGDCEILALESDPEAPGIFLKARKPADFHEADLSGVAPYSMISASRIRELQARHFRSPAYARTRVTEITKNAGRRVLGWARGRS